MPIIPLAILLALLSVGCSGAPTTSGSGQTGQDPIECAFALNRSSMYQDQYPSFCNKLWCYKSVSMSKCFYTEDECRSSRSRRPGVGPCYQLRQPGDVSE